MIGNVEFIERNRRYITNYTVNRTTTVGSELPSRTLAEIISVTKKNLEIRCFEVVKNCLYGYWCFDMRVRIIILKLEIIVFEVEHG